MNYIWRAAAKSFEGRGLPVPGLGIGDALLTNMAEILPSERLQFVSLFGMKSKTFQLPSGVPQGSHLGPLLFNVLINSVCSVIFPAWVLLFADDAKIFHAVSSIEDCKILQNILNKFSSWREVVGFYLNIGKC